MKAKQILFLILIALFCLPVTYGTEQAKERPNIVIILSDDYGYGSAVCYGANPKLIQTPNIDRLAKEGRRFTDANTTSSVCSPTRYSLLTGRYCWRTSLKHEVLSTTAPLLIEPGRINLASMLKKHGYRTAAIGKWHLGYGDQPKTDFTKELKPGPLEIGFDYHFGVPSNHGDITGVYVENHKVWGLRSGKLNPESKGRNFKNKPFIGLDAPHRVDEEVMPFLTRKAVEWIEAQSKDRPFFLYFTPVAVHNPVTPSAKTKGTSRAGAYGDWIHELDLSVGCILEALDRRGVTDNTVVLFTSDNGGVNKPSKPCEATDALKAGLKISGPFRGGKHDVWNGGFRVPYLVRWPGHVPAGTVCDEMLSLVDTLATIAALIGEPLPPKEVGAEDSYNMLPAWLGTNTAPIRRDLILHSADGNFAIRRGPWKWIEGDYHPATKLGALRLRADQFHQQLYNLKQDISESHDVLQNHPETARELEVLLNRYRDGAYSRELPPPSPERKRPKPLHPIRGKIVRRENFDDIPGKPWVRVRGKWTAQHGVLRGSQQSGDRVGAALRVPLGLDAGDIQYRLKCPFDAIHILRLQGHRRDLVCLISINPRRLAIMRQALGNEAPGNKVLAETRLRLHPKDWARVRVHFEGDEIAAEVDGTVVRAKDPAFVGKKVAAALMVKGRNAAFQSLEIYGPAE